MQKTLLCAISFLLLNFCISANASLKYRVSRKFDELSKSADKAVDRGEAGWSDAGITALVKSKLVNDPLVEAARINVDTVNRVVYLNGKVSSIKARQRAIEKTKEVGGITKIVNRLQVAN
jgi:osmotically-inducible protein OsmY